MSVQGFAGGLMQGYDFMGRQYDRRQRRDLAGKREQRAQDTYEYNRGVAEEQRELQQKQRETEEMLKKARAAQYKLQNNMPLDEEEQGLISSKVQQDEKTRWMMGYIDKAPQEVYDKANRISMAIEGKGSLDEAIRAGNDLIRPWIQQGDGKNKRITSIKPMGGKAYVEMAYEDEDGNTVEGAPLSTRRSKDDKLVKEFDIGKLALVADQAKQLAALRIRHGDNSPLEQQAAQQQARLGAAQEERSNRWDYRKTIDKQRLVNQGKLSAAAIKAQDEAEQSLGEIPKYIDQAITEPVVDEDGNPQLDDYGKPMYTPSQQYRTMLAQFAVQRGYKDWDTAFQDFQQYKQQLQAQERVAQGQQKAQELRQTAQQSPEKARLMLQNIQKKDPQAAAIVQRIAPDLMKQLSQPEEPQPKAGADAGDYSLGRSLGHAKQRISGAGRGMSDWLDNLNVTWKD